MNKSLYEIQMATILKRAGYKFVEEYRFTPPRRFRFDFALPKQKIAIEVEGGSFMKFGRHGWGKGFQSDCEKYNLAMILGWKVLRYVPSSLLEVVDDLEKLIN